LIHEVRISAHWQTLCQSESHFFERKFLFWINVCAMKLRCYPCSEGWEWANNKYSFYIQYGWRENSEKIQEK